MREIKFRAWFKNEVATQMLVDDTPGDCLRWKAEGQDIEALMQYTGLKDKNSVEIYEGDVVTYLDGSESNTESGYDFYEYTNVGQIIFDDEYGRYDVTNKEAAGCDDVFEGGGDFEVIGNIYENPELLVGDQNGTTR